MEEWKEYKLGEVTIPVRDRIDTSVLDASSYISTENMLPDKAGVTLSSGIPSGKAIQFKDGDVLISNIRPYFKKIWRADKAGGCSADVICLRATKEIEPLFLYYLLSQELFFDYVMQGAKGTKMPRGDRNQIMQWPVFLPSKSEQQIIASILSALDDKIEVNRQINDNLEQQAQALFKSWFVDLEPFKNGKFIDTGFGLIPKGWRVLAFKDFIEASTEKAPVDSLPEYSVTNNGIIPREAKFNKKLSKSSSMNKVLRKDNLVFGMSREILNWGIMEDEIGGVSSAYNIYKLNQQLISPTYLKLYMKARLSDFNSLIGTAAREGQSLDKGQLMQKQIYRPSEKVLQDFFDIYRPITKAKRHVSDETSRIASLRDTLLPRLMSGELKINEIENVI